MAGSATAGYVTAGCGAVLTLLGAAVALIFMFFVIQDSGNISRDEAIPGVIGGACCSFSSILIVAAGVVLVMQARKKTDDAPPPAAP